MLNKLFNLINSKSEEKNMTLDDKLKISHERVLDSFESFGMNMGPVPMCITNQEILQDMKRFEWNRIGLGYGKDIDILGIYAYQPDIVLLDESFCNTSSSKKISKTIAHEYGHRLSHKIFDVVRRKVNREKRTEQSKINRIALPYNEISNKEIIAKRKEQPQIKLTESEKRVVEFDLYFDEMFAESVALYSMGFVDGDRMFLEYSRLQNGEVLSADKQFMERTEKLLHQAFFDRMFTHGLKRVALEMPIIYKVTRKTLSKNYQREIPNMPMWGI
jgi:hypothetical protein